MDSDDRVLREEILRREVLAGSEQAWRIWYGETFDGLYQYVLWRCGGRRDWADDIVQETWLTAVRRIRRFAPREGNFLSWLRGIAANVLRNHFRRQKTRKKTIGPICLKGPEGAAHKLDLSPFSANEKAEKIAAVLDALADRHEAVLRAKYLDGLSVAEIAASWRATPKAVESLLTRARESFRELYEKMSGKNV
jgi:RNA polymerase sigma-70 factor (ECF subfamily)